MSQIECGNSGLYEAQIAARDEQYRLFDAAAEAGNGVAMAEFIRVGRLCDEAATMIITNTYNAY